VALDNLALKTVSEGFEGSVVPARTGDVRKLRV
jgi:hypothetical protein